MLSNKLKRCLSFLMAMLMIVSLMPVSVLATDEEPHDHSHEVIEQAAPETQETIEEEVPDVEKPTGDALSSDYEMSEAAQDIQAIIDDMLGYYLPEVTAVEAVSAAVEAMTDDDCCNAYGEIMDLEYEIFAAQVDGLLSDADLEALYYGNPMLIAFADAVVPRGEALTPSWGYLTTVDVLDGKVTVTDTANSNTVSGGTVTIKASGSLLGKKTNTITIENKTSDKATLAFDYSASKYSSFKIAGAAAAASGSYSVLLDAGGTLKIELVSNSGFSNTTATLTLQNFSLTVAKDSSKVTFAYDSSLGSVTASGTAVTSGSVQEVSLKDGVALVATAKSGASFFGWVNAADGSVLSTATSFTYVPVSDIKVKAVFATSSQPCFYVGQAVSTTEEYKALVVVTVGSVTTYTLSKDYLFDNFADAMNFAKGSNYKYVTLANNATLSAGNYEVPSGVSLLIPFNDAYNMYTTNTYAIGDGNSWKQPTAYRTLTLAEGANLVVNGAMSVSAQTCYAAGSKVYGGSPTGPCGFVKMQENSSITVNGKLYTYGYITGSGTVTANSGATVYECFQIMDFRGGSQSTDMQNGVFPLSQYYVQNIEVPFTIKAGAKEYAFTTMYMSSTRCNTAALFIGSGGLFDITSGSLTKTYDGSTDRLVIDMDGVGSLSSMSLAFGSTSIDSQKYDLGINNNITVNINNGANVSIKQDLAMLPGSVLNINKGSNVTLGSGNNIYVYDADQWGTFCYGGSNKKFSPLTYAPSKTYTRTEADLVDAKVVVNGNVDASVGYVYTTAGGANIISEGTGVVKTKAGTQTITHQLVQGADYTQITITPAKLKNADGSTFADTANAKDASGKIITNSYTYTDGYWRCATHSNYDNNPAACDVCGVEMHDHSYNQNTVKEDALKSEANCASPAVYYKSCSCGDVDKSENAATFTDGEKDPTKHTGNTEVIGATAATCTADGYTGDTHCSDCDVKIKDGTTITAQGHNKTHHVKVDSTCTATGTIEYWSCDRCGKNYSDEACTTEVSDLTIPMKAHSFTEKSEQLVSAATCMAPAVYKAKCATCTLVSDTKVVEVGDPDTANGHNFTGEIKNDENGETHSFLCVNGCENFGGAKDHEYGDWEVTKAATCAEAGSQQKTCACGHVVTEEIPMLEHDYNQEVADAKFLKSEARCTAKAVYYKSCTCGAKGTDTFEDGDPLGHKLTFVKGYAATCVKDGVLDHYNCSVCGKNFADENGVNILEDKDLVLPAVPENHVLNVDETVDPTCTEVGYTVYKCENCEHRVRDYNKPALGHNGGVETGEAATCTEPGWKQYYVCDNCDKKFSDAECKNEITNFEAWKVGDGKIDALGHNWAPATFEAPKTCRVCGTTEGEKLVAAAQIGEQKFETLIAAVEAAQYGAEIVLLEDAVLTERLAIAAKVTVNLNGNNITANFTDDFGAIYVKVGAELTVKGEGVILNKADVAIANYGKVIIEGGTVKSDAADYNCGLYNMYHNGDVYGTAEIKGGTIESEVWNSGVLTVANGKLNGIDNSGALTITGGIVNGTIYAQDGSDAPDLANKATIVISGGTFENAVDKAWCAEGYGPDKDAVNGYYGVHKHVAGAAVEEAGEASTCTVAGYKWSVVKCSECGFEMSRTKVDLELAAHTAGEAVKENEKASTCTVAGSYESVVNCTVCGEELSRETKALELAAHTEGAVVVENNVAPSCTAKGSYDNVVYCTVCNAELSRNTVTVDKIAHTYNAEVTAPTCTAKGYTTYTCACGDSYTADEVAATGHVNTTTTTVDATCTTDGSITVTCACGEVVSTEVIKATGHTPAAAVRENENAATCTVDGSYDEVVYCSVCKTHKISTKTVTVPATGNHNYVDGVCSVCGDKEVIEPDVYFKAISVAFDSELMLQLKFTIPNDVLFDDTIVMKMVKKAAVSATELVDYDYIVEYTMADIRNMTKDSNGRYVFVMPLSSVEIGRDVTVQFIKQNGQLLNIHDYSTDAIGDRIVRSAVDYAVRIYQLGSDRQKQLVKGMLVYGGYAQKYFGVDADEPVYNTLTELGVEIPSIDEITANTIKEVGYNSGSDIGITQTTQSPSLESLISHKVYFTISSGHTIDEYTFKLTAADDAGKVSTFEVTPTYQASKNRYFITIDDIAAPNLDYMYKITVTHNSSGETYEMNTSVMTWVSLIIQKSNNINQINLAKALYIYNQEANIFFGR